MKPNFDLAKFIEKSKALDLTGIEWSEAKTQPVSEAEIRCLTYMMDVETYTIAYLRSLLNTRAILDQEISDFLPCWAYEEAYHGRALERFLLEAGVKLEPTRLRSFQRPVRLWETIKDFGAEMISQVFDEFTAVYMTWGAIQELTTLTGYNNLARKSRNKVLVEILRRIMRDESRHFGFYYNKSAERLLRSKNAQRLTSFMLKKFWMPVGAGIMSDEEVTFITAYVFGDDEGREAARHIDEMIAKLPGLDWFNRIELYVNQSCQRLMTQSPWQVFAEQTSS